MLVDELVERIRVAFLEGAGKGPPLRLVRQFVMDADRSDTPELLMAAAPGSTGDSRWDALIAGVCEDVALRHGTKVPAWTATGPLEEFWFVTDFDRLHPTAFVESPAALARRGVFMRRSSLVNL